MLSFFIMTLMISKRQLTYCTLASINASAASFKRRCFRLFTASSGKANAVDERDVLLDEARQHEEAPDPVNDARNCREQFDHRHQRSLEPDRTQLGDEKRDAESDRDADQHRD